MREVLRHHTTTPENRSVDVEDKVQFIPTFPIPYEGNQTSTLTEGWLFSIPLSSIHKDLAWELITIMREPDILGSYLVSHAHSGFDWQESFFRRTFECNTILRRIGFHD